MQQDRRGFKSLQDELAKLDWILCRYNYGKNLKKVQEFSKINDPKIGVYLEQEPLESFIDFEDESNEEIEIEGVITVCSTTWRYPVTIQACRYDTAPLIRTIEDY